MVIKGGVTANTRITWEGGVNEVVTKGEVNC